uniref:Uncharacterized protein n=1 Tax=Arundo donax TaxID=35708 RepID=A0A0A9D571_ARUDO
MNLSASLLAHSNGIKVLARSVHSCLIKGPHRGKIMMLPLSLLLEGNKRRKQN